MIDEAKRQDLSIRTPLLSDAQGMERMASECGELDVHNRYAYLLCCSLFKKTSRLAVKRGEPAGFLTALRVPEYPERLFVWQIGVRPDFRGQGVARALLNHVVLQSGPPRLQRLEATVAPSNLASMRLFEKFAASQDTALQRCPFFAASLFPDDHEGEDRISLELATDPTPTPATHAPSLPDH